MNNTLVRLSVLGGLFALPMAAFALAFPNQPSGTAIVPGILILNILNFVWPIIVTVIVFTFIYAGFEFLTAQGEEGKLATARKAVIWGVAGVAVILLAFSIVAMVQFAFGLV